MQNSTESIFTPSLGPHKPGRGEEKGVSCPCTSLDFGTYSCEILKARVSGSLSFLTFWSSRCSFAFLCSFPALRRQRQNFHCQLEDIQLYLTMSRPAKATWGDPVRMRKERNHFTLGFPLHTLGFSLLNWSPKYGKLQASML